MRIQAKQNLNVILESNSKRKNNNSLFDKLWYTKREEISKSENGFVFDGQGFVANSLTMIKVTDANFKESIV